MVRTALTADDFPLEAQGKRIYANGEQYPIMEALTPALARNIAELLNQRGDFVSVPRLVRPDAQD